MTRTHLLPVELYQCVLSRAVSPVQNPAKAAFFRERHQPVCRKYAVILRILMVLTMAFWNGVSIGQTVVFVPGYYGSKLIHKATNEVKWLTLGRLIWETRNLARCVPENLKVPCLNLVPGGVLDEVGVVPGLFGLNIYGDAVEEISTLARKAGFQFKTFSYDWRDSVDQSSRRLSRFVAALSGKVYLLAHSFGGLVVTGYVLNDGQQQRHTVLGVAFVGTPFRGAVQALRNLIEGRQAQGTGELLPAVAFGTFPSSYGLVPRGETVLVDGAGRDMSDDVEDPEVWRRNGWGLYSTPGGEAPKAKFIAAQLRQRQEAARVLAAERQWDSTRFPVLNFRSRSRKALGFLQWNKQNRRLGPIPKGGTEPGDGTVTWKSAGLPDALKSLPHFELELVEEHLEMLESKIFLDRLRAELTAVKPIEQP